MRVLMVVESMFGNTDAIGEAVAVGLREKGAQVTLLRAGEPRDHALREVDLLVLAAPTHGLSLSRPSTRADAVTQGADEARAAHGVREWLAAVDGPDDDWAERPPVAVFDTRASVVRHWPGSASRPIRRALRRRGFTVVDRASFYVEGVKGPVVAGELDRARAWGADIAPMARRPLDPRDADA